MSKENASTGQGEKLRVVENYPGVEDCWVWTLPGPEKFASDGHLSIRNAELYQVDGIKVSLDLLAGCKPRSEAVGSGDHCHFVVTQTPEFVVILAEIDDGLSPEDKQNDLEEWSQILANRMPGWPLTRELLNPYPDVAFAQMSRQFTDRIVEAPDFYYLSVVERAATDSLYNQVRSLQRRVSRVSYAERMRSLRDKGPEALWQEISHFVRDPDKAMTV